MADMVIAPDLKGLYDTLKTRVFSDLGAARVNRLMEVARRLIERVSKAEQENVALKAENERLTKIIEDSRMDLKGFDEETLAWFAAGGQKGK